VYGRDVQEQTDPVEQRSGNFGLVVEAATRCAQTCECRILKMPEAASVHRRDKLETVRKIHVVVRARDDGSTGLHWLTKGLERRAIEFRELIEKKHTIVCEGYLARLDSDPTAHQCR
jgi:hypothetical protein